MNQFSSYLYENIDRLTVKNVCTLVENGSLSHDFVLDPLETIKRFSCMTPIVIATISVKKRSKPFHSYNFMRMVYVLDNRFKEIEDKSG